MNHIQMTGYLFCSLYRGGKRMLPNLCAIAIGGALGTVPENVLGSFLLGANGLDHTTKNENPLSKSERFNISSRGWSFMITSRMSRR